MAEFQRKQIAAYEQRGPFWGRLTQFGAAVAAVAAIVVTTLVCDTVASFYPGTGVVKSSPAERPAEATVRDCRRVGPVSGDGFGYWWHCEVTIRTHDGREVDTVVKHSIVTPDDRGSPSSSGRRATRRTMPTAGTGVPRGASGPLPWRCCAW